MIMSLNMVANRVGKGFDLAYFGKWMSPLRMSKHKMYAENIPEWEEGTKNASTTAGIGHLLSNFLGVMAPHDQVAKVQVERELGVVLSGMKMGYAECDGQKGYKVRRLSDGKMINVARERVASFHEFSLLYPREHDYDAWLEKK